MPKKKGLPALRKAVATRKPAKAKAKRKHNPDTTFLTRPAPRAPRAATNPPLVEDVTMMILPGLGSYAATRLTGRLLRAFLEKRLPKVAPHLGPVGNLGAFVALWFAAHKVRRLQRYHTPIVVGAGIALVQAIIQTYLPRLGLLLDAAPVQTVATPQATSGVPRRRRMRYVVPGEIVVSADEPEAGAAGATSEITDDSGVDDASDSVVIDTGDSGVADDDASGDDGEKFYDGVFAR